MGRLSQVGWNKAVEDRLAQLEQKARGAIVELQLVNAKLLDLKYRFEVIEYRLQELEAKRGPGRPRIERDTAGSDRKV